MSVNDHRVASVWKSFGVHLTMPLTPPPPPPPPPPADIVCVYMCIIHTVLTQTVRTPKSLKMIAR